MTFCNPCRGAIKYLAKIKRAEYTVFLLEIPNAYPPFKLTASYNVDNVRPLKNASRYSGIQVQASGPLGLRPGGAGDPPQAD